MKFSWHKESCFHCQKKKLRKDNSRSDACHALIICNSYLSLPIPTFRVDACIFTLHCDILSGKTALHPMSFYFIGNMQALGMESGAIADSQITASSEHDIKHGPKRARLYTPDSTMPGIGLGQGAWCSSKRDLNQWLQVDLGKVTPVTHVATQGRNSFSPGQWVRKYKLQSSDDGASFLFYKRQENLQRR